MTQCESSDESIPASQNRSNRNPPSMRPPELAREDTPSQTGMDEPRNPQLKYGEPLCPDEEHGVICKNPKRKHAPRPPSRKREIEIILRIQLWLQRSQKTAAHISSWRYRRFIRTSKDDWRVTKTLPFLERRIRHHESSLRRYF